MASTAGECDSTSLTREMQTETPMRFHFTPVTRATTETNVGMGVEKPERLTLGGRNTTCATIVGYHSGSSIKRNYQMISKSTVECIHGRSEISKGCLYTCSRQCHSE